jgi:hypothetical protein
MQLGIVVTNDRYRDDVNGLIRAARNRGWEATCFLTDTGVRLLENPEFMAAARSFPKSVSVCEHSVEGQGIATARIEGFDAIVVGGQYQDAELVTRSDRVLVF